MQLISTFYTFSLHGDAGDDRGMGLRSGAERFPLVPGFTALGNAPREEKAKHSISFQHPM